MSVSLFILLFFCLSFENYSLQTIHVRKANAQLYIYIYIFLVKQMHMLEKKNGTIRKYYKPFAAKGDLL